jgi:hypothetical protein
MPGPVYLVGKMLSNLAVLATMVAVLAAAAGAMQIVLGEDRHVQLLPLVTPLALVTLPVMGLVAAMGVCFEVIPFLRGGLGNVAYFFLWIATLSLSAATGRGQASEAVGISRVVIEMQAACTKAFPDYAGGGNYTMGFNIKDGTWDPRTFVWDGLHWTPEMLAWRAFWMAIPFALTLLASLFFDRFDTQRAGVGGRMARPARGRGKPAPQPGEIAERAPAFAASHPVAGRMLSGAAARAGRSRLAALVLAELRIALKGVSRWWWLVALGLAVASLFAPLAAVRGFLVPFALVWPVLRWSAMGTREISHRTDALLFSSPRPIAGLLAAQWLAGWIIAVMASAGALVRFAVTAEWGSLAALLAGVVFIPAMALACGTWTGGGKLFEVLYLILWYGGPMNRIPPIDFVGATQPAAGPGAPILFTVAAAALMSLALLGRRRQLRR